MDTKAILELEEILNQEIEAYSKLEEYINGKKNCLINGDMEKVRIIDTELEKYNCVVEKLEEKRKQLSPENLTLKEIIERIENKEHAHIISNLRNKMKKILSNVQKQNKINMELIKHSLKMVENSIVLIANALVPEGSAYNQKGATRMGKGRFDLSSVDHEAWFLDEQSLLVYLKMTIKK